MHCDVIICCKYKKKKKKCLAINHHMNEWKTMPPRIVGELQNNTAKRCKVQVICGWYKKKKTALWKLITELLDIKSTAALLKVDIKCSVSYLFLKTWCPLVGSGIGPPQDRQPGTLPNIPVVWFLVRTSRRSLRSPSCSSSRRASAIEIHNHVEINNNNKYIDRKKWNQGSFSRGSVASSVSGVDRSVRPVHCGSVGPAHSASLSLSILSLCLSVSRPAVGGGDGGGATHRQDPWCTKQGDPIRPALENNQVYLLKSCSPPLHTSTRVIPLYANLYFYSTTPQREILFFFFFFLLHYIYLTSSVVSCITNINYTKCKSLKNYDICVFIFHYRLTKGKKKKKQKVFQKYSNMPRLHKTSHLLWHIRWFIT